MRQHYSRNLASMLAGYASAAAFCVFASSVYSLYGHGVRSMYMDLAFLYPMAGGGALALALFLKPAIAGRKFFRLGANLCNSGLAALAVGSFLQGVMDIAGTASKHIMWFFALGALMVAAAIPPLFLLGKNG